MKKKILITVILLITILSNIAISYIYANENEIVSIPNAKVKTGEQAKVYLNLENIEKYTISKIVLGTDIYLEPVLDTAKTNLTKDNITFNNEKKEFTITNIDINIKTLCVSYTIPQYIALGTKIKLNVAVFGYEDEKSQIEEEKYKKTYEIIADGKEQDETVNGEEKNQNENNNINNDNNNNSNISNINNSINQPSQVSAATNKSVSSSSTQTVTYKGSRNNYLTNVTVSGYDLTPEFKKTNSTYFLKVANDVTSLTVTAAKEDSTSVMTISRQHEFKSRTKQSANISIG
jgi:hypothetical protein